jgi:outer membrane protein assembly factor BamB
MSKNSKKIPVALAAMILIATSGYFFYSCESGNSVDLSGKVVGWREDNRTGVSSETGLLTSWPEGGPALVWANTQLPAGHSSPAIGNNTIYITGNKADSDILVALDNKGIIKWQTPYGRSWTAANPESRCTPTVDGDRVYVSSGFGDLACIDASSGSIIWTLNASEKYQGTYGNWGIAESLLIDGDKVYYSPGGPETMTIALNKTNGDLIWKSASLGDKPGYVSPILINFAGINAIVNVSLGHLYAVDASNGDILWSVSHYPRPESGMPSRGQQPAQNPQSPPPPPRDLIKCTTPLYKDGMVYVTGGYDAGGMMVTIGPEGKSANVAWTDSTLDDHHGGVVELNGYIYGSNWLSNADGDWCCIEWNTGKTMWEEHWNCKGSIIAAEGMLYIYDEKNGNVGLVKASPEKFDLVSSFQVTQGNNGPFWAHPMIHNGILYLRHMNALMTYNIKAK